MAELVGLMTEVKIIMDHEPKRISDEDTIIVLMESKQRRRSIGEIIFWTVSHLPCLLIIWWGAHIHHKGRILLRGNLYPLTGDMALGFSWVIIGLGIGGLAYSGVFFWTRPLLKWLLYIIGGIVVTKGIWQSFFK